MIFLLTKFKDFFRVSTFHKVVNKALSVTAFAQRKFAVDTYFFFYKNTLPQKQKKIPFFRYYLTYSKMAAPKLCSFL